MWSLETIELFLGVWYKLHILSFFQDFRATLISPKSVVKLTSPTYFTFRAVVA